MHVAVASATNNLSQSQLSARPGVCAAVADIGDAASTVSAAALRSGLMAVPVAYTAVDVPGVFATLVTINAPVSERQPRNSAKKRKCDHIPSGHHGECGQPSARNSQNLRPPFRAREKFGVSPSRARKVRRCIPADGARGVRDVGNRFSTPIQRRKPEWRPTRQNPGVVCTGCRVWYLSICSFAWHGTKVHGVLPDATASERCAGTSNHAVAYQRQPESNRTNYTFMCLLQGTIGQYLWVSGCEPG